MNKKIDINFDWKYSPSFNEEYLSPNFDDTSFKTVQIPHANIETPYNNFDEKMYQFESCYRKSIWIDEVKNSERVSINFEGVMTYAKVYLNGSYVGEHKGGYTPFKIDLTDTAITNAENLLVVYVDSNEREDIPPFGFVVDYLTYGGIYREVSLEYSNQLHIENLGIKTKNVLTNSPSLDVDIYLSNLGKEIKDVTFQFDLIFKNKTVKSFSKSIKLNGGFNEIVNIKEDLKQVHLWDTDNPNLYFLNLTLAQANKNIDNHTVRFGFREIAFKESGFYLNGNNIKIQGLNRHQSFPYVGYAMPKSAQYKDADILKEDLGVNTVRLSHYPQSDHFMDRCDEIGLLVFDEIPGWQHIGDKKWQDVALQNVREMILKDMNHPSVIIWGVRINESQDDDEFYTKTNELARSIDDSRPTGGVRCITKSNLLEDVYTYNDFSHTGGNSGVDKKRKVTSTKKPYLITEYNGHMFPTKKFDDESHRLEHALRHMNVIDAMRGEDSISGAIGWCMFDYNTHKDFGSGDKICYHGVMDMFRIPKHATYVYQSQSDLKPVMHISSPLNIGEFEGSLLEDIYIFTNCDYVKLYRHGKYINTFYPDKKKYKNVKHAPIIVDDFIGDAIKDNEQFSPKDAQIIKNLLTSVSKNGVNLSILDTLKMGWMFLKYKMNQRDAEDLYTKYFGGWGGAAIDYRFEGYINDKCVLETTKSQVFNPILKMTPDCNILLEKETYDTTRVLLNLVDDYGNDIVYAHDTVIIETEGPIEIIGPKVISLIGGSVGFWVKTTGESGTGRVIIKSERFGVLEDTFSVTKEIL
ncbi:MAG: glycoside hydrolase family 2 protein [Spirochaetaceae bacterium]